MNAVITISGIQGIAGDKPDTIELVTEGIYCRTEDGFEIRYHESEITGLNGTETSVEINPDGVVVERKGMLNSRMVFRQGEKSSFLYDTPYGSATLGVDTRKINAKLNDLGGELSIDYVVNMEHAVVSKNMLKMSVRTRS